LGNNILIPLKTSSNGNNNTNVFKNTAEIPAILTKLHHIPFTLLNNVQHYIAFIKPSVRANYLVLNYV